MEQLLDNASVEKIAAQVINDKFSFIELDDGNISNLRSRISLWSLRQSLKRL